MKTSRMILMLLLAGTATAACDKNTLPVISGPQTGGANVKFFNFSVGSPSVNFYINNKKATAVSATGCYLLTDANRAQCLSTGIESNSGVAYGSAGNGTNAWYSDVVPGTITIAGKITAVTDNGLAIGSVQAPVATGHFYSFYLSGIYDATAKATDAFIVEDVMPPQDFTAAYVRFVNASSTTQPMTLYAKDATSGTEIAIGGDVAYKSAGAFIKVPLSTYNLSTRVGGSSTNVFTRTGVSWSAGRAYTITARGNTSTASTMSLDNTANR